MAKEKFLTNRQKEFARHYVGGTHSNAQCARLAGYSNTNGIAKIQAHKLLDEKDFPHVAEYIKELREEKKVLLKEIDGWKAAGSMSSTAARVVLPSELELKNQEIEGLKKDKKENKTAIQNMQEEIEQWQAWYEQQEGKEEGRCGKEKSS